MKNSSLYFIAILSLVVLVSGCGQNAAPPVGGTTGTIEAGVVNCRDDTSCLHSNFLACHAAEFKMPFMQNSEYSITIVGVENGNCHYRMSVTGQSTNDCIVPKDLINEDRFGHFFGSEKVPGKEKIAEEQQKLDTDYCKQEY